MNLSNLTLRVFIQLTIVYLISIMFSFAQVEERWIARFNKYYPVSDEGQLVVVDTSNNIYVTGNSSGASFTVKYNSMGQEQWRLLNKYISVTDNTPQFMELDSEQNIIVAGSRLGGSAQEDLVFIKYNPNGEEQWVVLYDSPDHKSDSLYGLAVDSLDNIYAVGKKNTAPPYETVKLNKDGILQWSAGYGEAGKEPKDIAVDSEGNVYVTGNDITIKYNSVGVEQWVIVARGDFIELDSADNIYVYHNPNLRKINSDGVEQWKISPNGTYMKVESVGNVLICDSYNGLRKYNTNGIEQWGTGELSFSIVNSIALDDEGNSYLTGYYRVPPGTPVKYDWKTQKYNSEGIKQWEVTHNGIADGNDYAYDVCIDSSKNVYVTGFVTTPDTLTDAETIKYDDTGQEVWIASYAGYGGNNEGGNAISLDPYGNAYVTGYIQEGSQKNFLTVKYDNAGSQLWATEYDGIMNDDDEAKVIAVDQNGNAYVAGKSKIGMASILITIKYDSNGVQQWATSYSYCNPCAIALDDMGNVYVGGYSGGYDYLVENSDAITIKYDNAGVQQWVATYNGITNSDDAVFDIGLDNMGNVYVTGYTNPQPPGYLDSKDIVTIKYNSLGVQQWIRTYSRSYYEDVGYGIAVTGSGDVYVTGFSNASYSPEMYRDYVTIKYDTAGNQQWAKIYNGTGSNIDIAYDIAVDNSGNAYVTGKSYGGSSNWNDCVTLKYDNAGNQLWVQRYNGSKNKNDEGRKLVTDSYGNVYVTGMTTTDYPAEYCEDYLTIMYDTNGLEQWAMIYDGSINGTDGAKDIACDYAGNVYVTGESSERLTSYDMTTIKYSPNLVSVEEELWMCY